MSLPLPLDSSRPINLPLGLMSSSHRIAAAESPPSSPHPDPKTLASSSALCGFALASLHRQLTLAYPILVPLAWAAPSSPQGSRLPQVVRPRLFVGLPQDGPTWVVLESQSFSLHLPGLVHVCSMRCQCSLTLFFRFSPLPPSHPIPRPSCSQPA